MIVCVLESVVQTAAVHFSYSLQCCGDPCAVFRMRCQLEFKSSDALNLLQHCVNKHLSPTERHILQNLMIEFTECSGLPWRGSGFESRFGDVFYFLKFFLIFFLFLKECSETVT